jgi:hypothetical protein
MVESNAHFWWYKMQTNSTDFTRHEVGRTLSIQAAEQTRGDLYDAGILDVSNLNELPTLSSAAVSLIIESHLGIG